MNPKLQAKLFEAIDKFVEDNCTSEEWEWLDFLAVPFLADVMTAAAATVFDMNVSASKLAEETYKS